MAYTNSDVAHAWAHNLDKCYYGSNFSHNNGILKSYSTCIGQRLELNGNIVFLINTYRYSNSTSKHQGYMRYAIPSADDNVYIFAFDKQLYNSPNIISTYYTKERQMRESVVFGLEYLAREYDLCKLVATIKTKDIGFSRRGYEEMCRWFDVTGCMTVKKLLRMKLEEFNKYLPVIKGAGAYSSVEYNLNAKDFRKFLKMMADNESLETIVDAVNGKGTYKQYLERTDYLRESERNRRLSRYMGYNLNGTYRMFGKYPAARKGSISKAVRNKHKDGWMKWLLDEKHKNELAAINKGLMDNMYYKRMDCITRLERHCGVKWDQRFLHCGYGSLKPISSFDYNGVVIQFSKLQSCVSRSITQEEYVEYTNLSREEQKAWVIAKRRWMLNEILESERRYNIRMAQMEEERRIKVQQQERQAQMERERAEYKNALLRQGDAGLRQLWHEGFNVSLSGLSNPFFFGGNVLLRVIDNHVVTSKGIVIMHDECKRLWKLVQRWHINSAEFAAGEKAKTALNAWTISRYQNDILIAGCHAIAYREMERVARELGIAS